MVPDNALYYACLGCVDIGRDEAPDVAVYTRDGSPALVDRRRADRRKRRARARRRWPGLRTSSLGFRARYGRSAVALDTRGARAPLRAAADRRLRLRQHDSQGRRAVRGRRAARSAATRCRAAIRSKTPETLFAQMRAAGITDIGALAVTGYGKDLLSDIVGADVAIVETVAHATAALHFYPDADVICDVGGCDVKIMILRQGTVADFRLNSQCSSGNGAFLQGVAERYGVALDEYADRAFAAKAMPSLAMGCGVFLQSDIVNQQRKGWSADEIMAALAAVLPGQRVGLCGPASEHGVSRPQVRAPGRHAPEPRGGQGAGGLHPQESPRRRDRRPSVLRAKLVRIGAALCALEWKRQGGPTRFRGFETIEALTYTSTTSDEDDLPLVSRQLQAHVHRRAAARRRRAGPGAVCRSPKGGRASSAATPARRGSSRTFTSCASSRASWRM